MQSREWPLHGANPGDAWRRRAVDVYLTIRVSTLGFSWLLPLVGMAAATPGFDLRLGGTLLAVALAFHVYAYVLNDVVDLWVDRTEPLRADSPLVRGDLSRRQALMLAAVQVPLAFALAWAGQFGAAARGALAVAFVAMTLYDLYGKRCPWPLLTDAVQGVGWCALLWMGAAVEATAPLGAAQAVGWLCAYVFLCVMLVNGVHGALRDLANDRARGANTTAAWFGARAGVGTAVIVPRALAGYALALQAGLGACAFMAWAALDHGAAGAAAWAAAPVVAALTVATVSLMVAFGRAGDRRAFVVAGAGNIVATLAVLPALVLVRLGPLGSVVLMAAFTLPLAAMWAYNGTHWRLDGRLSKEQR